MRIVSLAPSATSILCALGARRQLVGVTRWCKDVVDVDGLPKVGDCWRGDPKKVVALKPDLVIGSVPYQAETVKALLDHNLTLLAKSPQTLEDVFADIHLLGDVVGKKKRAAEIVRKMKSEMKRIASLTRRAGRRPRVYCETWPKPLMTPPLWVRELIEIAGGRAVPAATTSYKVAERKILQAKPEIIVLAWAAAGIKVNGRKIYHRRGWKSLPAIRNGKVFVISDELLNTPAPILLEGLKRLARVIHPEIFPSGTDKKLIQVLQK